MNLLNQPDNRLRAKPHMLKRSHERQFNGEDWQAVAVDLCHEILDATEEDFNYLSSSPDPGCDCGFCAKAPWKD